MSYQLPELPYKYDALEPHIDERTMRIHHSKHHQGYTDKVNAALKGLKTADWPIEKVLRDIESVPSARQQTVINNGGGYANHRLFWKILSPEGGGEPGGKLAEAIDSCFDSFEQFKIDFSNAASNRFGSGWAWLCANGEQDLLIHTTSNQNSPYLQDLTPIMGLDVWEHAYYLNYQNSRGQYIDAFWEIIDWDQVSQNYTKAVY